MNLSLAGVHAAVAALLAAADGAGAMWTVPRAPGKWSPSQVAEHVARIMEESANVASGAPSRFPTIPFFLRPIVRILVFKRILGRSSFLKMKAIEPMDPATGSASPSDARVRLEAALTRLRAASGDVMDWVFRTYDDELKAWEVDLLWQAGTHIMGRRLYEEMAAYWPTSTEAFAPPMNEIPKVVFSKTMSQADWTHSRVSNGDVEEELARLKQESGKAILAHGGAEFLRKPQSGGSCDIVLFV